MDGTTKKYLWTGMRTLMRNEHAHFGSVAARSPLSEEGNVTIHLRAADVPAYVEHAGINLELPEARAFELAQKLLSITTQIAHLRGLNRQGLLAPAAVYEGEETQPDGDRVDDTDDERVIPLGQAVPEPEGSASVQVDADNAWLIYQTAAGTGRLLIEQVDALRTSRVAVFPRKPPVGTSAFISVVERSRWKREREHLVAVEEMDESPVRRQHFQVRFKDMIVEAIASRVTPR